MLAQAIRSVFRTTKPGPLSNFWYTPTAQPVASGVTVSDATALGVSTFWACVRVLSDTVGSMPLHVYKRQDDDRKTRDSSHLWYETLHNSPNVWQTPIGFKSMMIGHLLLRGNFYARIDDPQPQADRLSPSLVPLNPDRMQIPRQDRYGYITYKYSYSDGTTREYDQDQILHVKLLTSDGLVGMSPLTYARETLGLAQAQSGYAASLFGGGGFIKYYLKTSKRLGAEGKKNFREGWRDLHGDARTFEPPILEDDMDIKTLGMSNDDAQFLESRKFSAYELCQFLGVPPHLVFLLDRATFSNIEHQGLEFLTIHLNPYLVRIEQELQPWLGDDYFAEFLRDAIVRGDLSSRYTAYNMGLQAGFITPNEVRLRENLDPLPGGDELRTPLNMAPASGQVQQPRREPEPDEEEEEEEAEQAAAIVPDVRTFADMPESIAKRPAIDLAPLIADAAARIVAREIIGLNARIDKASKDPAGYFAWAVTWFEGHRDYAAKTITPLVTASQSDLDTSAWSAEYCSATVQEFASKEPAAVLKDWETTKAGKLAATIGEALCTTAS
jgi:HK97 family phage portal protein